MESGCGGRRPEVGRRWREQVALLFLAPVGVHIGIRQALWDMVAQFPTKQAPCICISNLVFLIGQIRRALRVALKLVRRAKYISPENATPNSAWCVSTSVDNQVYRHPPGVAVAGL